MSTKITLEIIMEAYQLGIFPMAHEEIGNAVFWHAPDTRCVISIENFHVSRSLRRTIRKGVFDVTVNKDFGKVIAECAAPREESPGVWLSEELIECYEELHARGVAHSVEVWQEGELAGGLFGVGIGAFFSGESMFHRVTDASKVALWATREILKWGGYCLFDVQYETPHLASFGTEVLSRHEYEKQLREAIRKDAKFEKPEPLVVK